MIRLSLALALGFAVSLPFGVPAQEDAPLDTVAPIVAAHDMVRYGTPGFSFEAPSTWEELGGDSAKLARLQFVANMREVFDEPPDVPPRAFSQLSSFTGFWIPEINGYLIAPMIQTTTFPVQLLDVLHEHGKRGNDWGESFYIRVEETMRNERFRFQEQPALAVDVRMSGRLSIATVAFRVPGNGHFLGALLFLLPSDNWEAMLPLIDHIRSSVEIHGDADPQQTIDIETTDQAVVVREPIDIDPDTPGFQPGYAPDEPQFRRPGAWTAQTENQTDASGVTMWLVRLILLAVVYAIAFLGSMRLAYIVVMMVGPYFMPAAVLESIREGAEESSLTMGLFKAPWLIMVCAVFSMLVAALALAYFMSQ